MPDLSGMEASGRELALLLAVIVSGPGSRQRTLGRCHAGREHHAMQSGDGYRGRPEVEARSMALGNHQGRQPALVGLVPDRDLGPLTEWHGRKSDVLDGLV